MLDQTTYDPYGNSTNTSSNAFKFTGRENGGGNGLYFTRSRYYAPAIARFISREPVGTGINAYQYVGDSPTNFADPTGLDSLDGPGDLCSSCIQFGPGGFSGLGLSLPLTANQGGLDIPAIYVDQNGAGVADPDTGSQQFHRGRGRNRALLFFAPC